LSEDASQQGLAIPTSPPYGRASDPPFRRGSTNQVGFALPHDYYFTAELLSN